jgi:gas vesicle protein
MEVISLKDMLSAVLLGAVVGAAATMFYFNHEQELSAAVRNLKKNGKQAINFLSSLGQDIEESVMRKG